MEPGGIGSFFFFFFILLSVVSFLQEGDGSSLFSTDTSEVDELRGEMIQRVVRRMNPTDLGRMPQEPPMSGQVLQHEFASQYLSGIHHLDPNVKVEVESERLMIPPAPTGFMRPLVYQDLGKHPAGIESARITMSLARLVTEVCEPSRSRCLNSLAIPSSHMTHYADEIYRYVPP